MSVTPRTVAQGSRGPVLHVGGTHTLAVIAREQLLGLRERGWAVHLACAPDGWERALIADGFPIRPVRLPHRASAREAALGAADLLRLVVRGRYRLVHTHNAHNGVVGRLVARLAGVPAVHTWRYSPLDATPNPLVRFAYAGLEGVASRAGQTVLFQNPEDLRTAVGSHIVPAPKALLVGNGVRLGDYVATPADGDRARSQLGLSADDRLVTCIARLVERKGQRHLLDAFAAVAAARPRARLLLVGDGPEEPSLRARAEAVGLASKVVFAGHRDDVAPILAASDLVCLPSRREGVPRAVMEAMAAGVPVVATDVVGTREVVRHEVTGLLVPYAEADPLAGALGRMLDDSDLRARLAARGREEVEHNWRAEAVVDRVSALYERLLQS